MCMLYFVFNVFFLSASFHHARYKRLHEFFVEDIVVIVVVFLIQHIGCQPEETTLHGGQSRSWSAEQRKENKRESLAAHSPSLPYAAWSEKIR